MESRLERNKRKKLRSKSNRRRFIIFVMAFALFFAGLKVVDESFREFLCLEDTKLFDYKYQNNLYNIHLFGDNYYIEQEKIDNVVNGIKAGLTSVKEGLEKCINIILEKINSAS